MSKTTDKAIRDGRPGRYKPEYDDQARKLCLLGFTDVKLAEYFEVSETTISNWKIEYPSFLEALKAGKEKADANVAEGLYKRAAGYTHEDKYFPPDPGAATRWLKNRQRDLWRDRVDTTIAGPDGDEVKVQHQNVFVPASMDDE